MGDLLNKYYHLTHSLSELDAGELKAEIVFQELNNSTSGLVEIIFFLKQFIYPPELSDGMKDLWRLILEKLEGQNQTHEFIFLLGQKLSSSENAMA